MRRRPAWRGRAATCAVTLVAGLVLPGAPALGQADGAAASPAAADGSRSGDGSNGEPRRAPGDDDERVRHVVTLVDEPVASYRGGKPGLPPTRPDRARGERRLDPESPQAQAYARHLERERNLTLARAERAVGRSLEIEHVLELATNGFTTALTAAEAQTLAQVQGVADVAEEQILELQTDAGPALIGAPEVWETTDPGLATKGEGVVAGIIDTGITPSNPSFAGTGPVDGHVHVNPRGDAGYVGVCNPNEPAYDATFPCNGKLIGAWDLINGQSSTANEPRDSEGHGSHVAGTVAGNAVDAALRPGPAAPATVTRRISGVAPHASLISYKVCPGRSCNGAAILAAVDRALRDQVDLLNYSISSADTSPWSDETIRAFLRASDAGIQVVTAAGNDGPAAGSVALTKGAPWALTVAATTHGRSFVHRVTALTGGEDPPGELTGVGVSRGVGPAPVTDAKTVLPANRLCGDAFPAGSFDGAIAVCDSGTFDFRLKAARVREAGGVGVIVVNTTAGEALFQATTAEPLVHLGYDDGVALRAWLARGSGHTATLSGVSVKEDPADADIMAGFSSRGPVRDLPLLAPHVAAPGSSILAADGVGDPSPAQWGLKGGTSMASPHAAGATGLLRALQPDWSPSELRSALMTTATAAVTEGAGAATDAFDRGAGRIDVRAASQAGLLLHEDDFAAADPAAGGDPRTLNVPELVDNTCAVACSWRRTLTATRNGTWTVATAGTDRLRLTVEPAGPLVLQAGDSVELVFTAVLDGVERGAWQHGRITLSSLDAPETHLLVAARAAAYGGPPRIDAPSRRDAGSFVVHDVRVDGSDPVVGLALASIQALGGSLSADPTGDNPYNELGRVFWTTFDVPAGAQQLRLDGLTTTAVDVDLYMGRGATPSAQTSVCRSFNTGNGDSCLISDPAAGTWWLLVQNYFASPNPPDAFSVRLGILGAPDTSAVDAPTGVQPGAPFDVRLRFDRPMKEGDELYGLLTLGSSAQTPRDLAQVPVTIRRLADDVMVALSRTQALPGEVVEHTITVRPNVLRTPLTYTLTDTLPTGTSYVPGSATGGATVTGGVLRWTGTLPAAGGSDQPVVLRYRTSVDSPHTRGTATAVLVSEVDNPGSRPVTLTRSFERIGCYGTTGLELDAELSDGPTAIAAGSAGTWGVLLRLTACAPVRQVKAQGGTAAGLVTTASTTDGTITARRINERNSLLQWGIGDLERSATVRARLNVSGTAREACGELQELTGHWTATARGLRDVTVQPVTVRVTC